MENVTLLDLSFNTSSAADGLDELIAKSLELAAKKEELTKAMKEEKAQLDAVAKAVKTGSVSQAEYKDALDKSAAANIALKRQMLDVNAEISSNNAAIKTNKTLLDAQESSVDALRAKLAQNTKALNAMSAAQRTGSEEGQKMVAETKALSDQLKELESAVGDNRRNVGNYAESITEALANTKGLTGATGALAGGLTSGVTAVKGFNTALKANPIMAIAGIVLTLINVIERLMKSNSEMANSLKAAFAPFEVIFQRLVNYITKLFTTLGEVITTVLGWITKAIDYMGLLSEETKTAIENSKRLAKLEYDIYDMETKSIVALSAQRREMEKLKSLAADQTKSTKEREEALKKAIEINKNMEQQELRILASKYQQIKAQNSLSYSTQEDVRKEAEALAALQAKQAEYAGQRKEMIGQISGYRKAAIDKAAADAKAATDKRVKEEESAAKAIAEAQKAALEKTLKDMDEQLTALSLSLREKEIANDTTQLKIENQKKFNEEYLKMERFRLEKGLITQQEYDNKRTEQELTIREMQEQIRREEEEKAKEREAINLQNKYDAKMMEFTNEFEMRQFALDAQYQQELEAAEKLGADTTNIHAKYQKAKEKLTQARVNSELSMASGLAGDLSKLMGEESKAGKAFAIVQATINTYLGASKALAQGGFWGIAQAAVVIAAGLKQVMTIKNTKDPETKMDTNVKKYAKGGTIFGASHAMGGVTFTGSNGQVFEAEGGENVYIMKKTASAEINALSSLNVAHGGKSFGTSGLYKFADGGQVSTLQMQQTVAEAKLSQRSINQLAEVVIGAVQAMPSPIVSVQDIDTSQANVQVVQRLASI